MNGRTADDAGCIAAAPKDPVTARAAWLVLGVWLLGTAGAFWLFELYGAPLQGTVAQSFALATPAPIEAWYREQPASDPAAGARLTLVRLHAPHCVCERDMASTVRKIEAEFQPRGVRFLDTADARLRAAGVTAAPAALVFDAAGRLVYYGPYGNATSGHSTWGSSAWCGGGGGLIESALERALQGGARFTTAPVTRGCFCTG